MEAQKLTDITRGLHHAATTTNALIAQQYVYMIDQFFDSLPDGTLQAKMAKVALDENHYMMVPLISLASPRGLSLDKMKVSLSVKIEEAETLVGTTNDDSKATRSSFSVSIGPRADKKGIRSSEVVDMDLEFAACDPPEAIMRVIEEYANFIRPIPLPDDMARYPPIEHIDLKKMLEENEVKKRSEVK